MMTGCIGRAADQVRHDRGVDHAQTLSADHAQIAVDHRHVVRHRPHHAGANRMMHGPHRRTHMRLDVGVGGAVGARRDLATDERR